MIKGSVTAGNSAAAVTALHGRQTETEAVRKLLDGLPGGHGGALVVHGEAGIGKTALVADALAQQTGFRCLVTTGAEFEMELAFAALHHLCAPLLGGLHKLQPPQRAALEIAFGMRGDGVASPFLIGLALLGLLSEAAQSKPVVCVIDDAQWLDTASQDAFAFVARRVSAERVAFVFCLREPAAAPQLIGLPQLALRGIGEQPARELLARELKGTLDDEVRERIISEARGNPLALIEFPHSVDLADLADLAGGFGLPHMRPLAWQLQEGFARQLAGLPAQTRALLLVAAAEPRGDALMLWRAVAHLGIDPDAANPAEEAKMLEIGTHVQFRHPLIRSAVYRAAPSAERRKAHSALAHAIDGTAHPDRRAWHRAQSIQGLDEDVASELEHCAGRAQKRGGLAASAAFLERAAMLTPDPVRRASRCLSAAQTMRQAGSPSRALDLLTRAEAGPLDSRQSGRAQLLRAQIALYTTRGEAAVKMLLDAAKALDGEQAQETYLEAFAAARWAGRLAAGAPMTEIGEAHRAAAFSRTPPRPVDLLLEALTLQVGSDHEAAFPALRRAVDAFVHQTNASPDDQRWLWLAAGAATDLWDAQAWTVLADRQVELARESGALAVLPLALAICSLAHVHGGRFTTAATQITEGYVLSESTGSVGNVYVDVTLSAWRGDRERVTALIDRYAADSAARGEGRALTAMDYATAVLHNGLGNYQLALDAAQRGAQYDEIGFRAFLPQELVEAAVRLGRPELAADAMARLTARARACGGDWAAGAELRSRALLTTGPQAGHLYQEAVDRLEAAQATTEAARARLLHGEWLRRQRRILEARKELQAAYQQLSRIGALGFASRAAAELQTIGAKVRAHGGSALSALTPQELLIARHVASGATSKEVAATLFLSPRTIDAHLRSIFRKLDVTSRRQLRELGLGDPTDGLPPVR